MKFFLFLILTVTFIFPENRLLFYAVESNDLAYVENSIKSGISINSRDRHGTSILITAARYGSLETLKFI